jgi:hypothetical protein
MYSIRKTNGKKEVVDETGRVYASYHLGARIRLASCPSSRADKTPQPCVQVFGRNGLEYEDLFTMGK